MELLLFHLGIDTVDYALYPDKETQMRWLKAYLEEKHQAEGSNRLVVEDDLEVLYRQVNKCALVRQIWEGGFRMLKGGWII